MDISFCFNTAVHSPPKIIKQPSSDEVLYQVANKSNENDKPFLIECEAEGEPAPRFMSNIFYIYTWVALIDNFVIIWENNIL